MRTIGESFDPRRNSLNFLRLTLALVVVINHALPLAAFRVIGGINGTGFAEIAVFGFFGISGFLIAGSAVRASAGRYLWQRFLRIFPAFWVCLLATAFVFGVIAWLHHPVVPHCGISCYFDARSNGPFGYTYRNLLLIIHQHSIAGTPTGSLDPLEWNGSLWSLAYEFLCYLILMALAVVGLLRHRGVVLISTVLLWTAIIVITSHLRSTTSSTSTKTLLPSSVRHGGCSVPSEPLAHGYWPRWPRPRCSTCGEGRGSAVPAHQRSSVPCADSHEGRGGVAGHLFCCEH